MHAGPVGTHIITITWAEALNILEPQDTFSVSFHQHECSLLPQSIAVLPSVVTLFVFKPHSDGVVCTWIYLEKLGAPFSAATSSANLHRHQDMAEIQHFSAATRTAA